MPKRKGGRVAKDNKKDMARKASHLDLGVFSTPSPRKTLTIIEIIACVLTFVWLCIALVFLTAPLGAAFSMPLLETNQTRIAMVITACLNIVMPLVVIWGFAIALRAAHDLRVEGKRLQLTIDAMRSTYLQNTHNQAETAPTTRHNTAKPAMGQTPRSSTPSRALVSPSRRGAAASASAAASQSPPPKPTRQLPMKHFLRALNFPDHDKDQEGFVSLNAALDDKGTVKLIHACQDMLTLLSEDSYYMDDFPPARPRPEIWRRFAKGDRGTVLQSIGQGHDETVMNTISDRLSKDVVFRDAAHHFLRQFERHFIEFEGNASASEIAALVNTRSARAFAIVGRAAGMFDAP
jgi:hypothetical protein